jgi:hypothetical protein
MPEQYIGARAVIYYTDNGTDDIIINRDSVYDTFQGVVTILDDPIFIINNADAASKLLGVPVTTGLFYIYEAIAELQISLELVTNEVTCSTIKKLDIKFAPDELITKDYLNIKCAKATNSQIKNIFKEVTANG